RSSVTVRSPARPAPATTTRPSSAIQSIIQNRLAGPLATFPVPLTLVMCLTVSRSGAPGGGSRARGRQWPAQDPVFAAPHKQKNRKIIAMDDTLADPLAGRLLDGRYAVTARIAHGGMARVYLAVDTRLDREAALKVMHAELD